MKINRTTFRIINFVFPAFIGLLYFIFYFGAGMMAYLGLVLILSTVRAAETAAIVKTPIFDLCATLYGAAIIVVSLVESSAAFRFTRTDENEAFGPGEESTELFPSRHSAND